MTSSWGWLLVPLELPRREAPNVNVELVEPWIVAIPSKLNLELQLILGHGPSTDGALGSDPRTAPGPIRGARGELTALDRFAGLFS